MQTTHKCPVEGCNIRTPHHILMCSKHWRMVPPDLQRQVFAAWNRGRVANLQDYLAVRAEAVRSVNTLIGESAND